ncbi:hypothetical protein PVAND_013234 [Polypedilum vanderplanki]|uniref:Uncharacterized protein n=1 Tax=Polypedilum vanderplanki TaxID=319348 RepID=A0A9J6CQX1_POLVA|nr:hypothetical protein PVAND_013234 [Polypedilum vanderplanki]
MKSILLTILNFIIAASTLDIDCEYKFIETKLQDLKLDTIDHVKISNRYTCVADQFLGNDDKNIGAVNGQHLEGLSNVDVRAITFTTIEVSKIPQGLGKVFPNLMSLSVDDFGLEVIYSSDLRDFKNLTFFSAMGNSFEILNSDLFINNPKI